MRCFTLCITIILFLILPDRVCFSQNSNRIAGKVLDKKENSPLFAVTVLIEELKKGTYSDSYGNFSIMNIPKGIYTIKVSLIGHKTFRMHIKVPSDESENLTIKMDDGSVDMKEIVVTSNPFAGNPKDISQSTLSISNLDMQIKKGASIGETLNFQPGISVRSNGTATYRPVIRGFSNNRILILENGLRMGDLSNSSDDHSVSSDGSNAEKIEVVRGPASLLYGSNAIGGVINVLTQSIPNSVSPDFHGEVTLDGASVNNQMLQTGEFQMGTGMFAFQTSLFNRKANEYKDPFNNKVLNSDLKSNGLNIGASYLSDAGIYGLSFSTFNNQYGLPVNQASAGNAERVYIKMKKDEIRLLSEKSKINSIITSYSLKAGYQKYSHDEINRTTGETGTSFGLESFSADLSANHLPLSDNIKGVLGLWVMTQKYTVKGEEAFTPDADYFSIAGYLLEQIKWGNISLQLGARYELNNIKIPDTEISGMFFSSYSKHVNSVSASAGAVYNLNEYVSLFSNIATAFRAPTIEELSSYAVHDATGSFDIGSRLLEKENNTGIDLGLRVRRENHSVEFSAYYNDVANYIYRKPTRLYYNPKAEQLNDRISSDPANGIPVFAYNQSDAIIYGFEAKAMYEFTGNITTTVVFDYTRGKLKGIDENLPLMPPLRFSLEQRYAADYFWAGIVFKFANEQNLTSPYETPDKGYGITDLYAGTRLITGGIIHMLTFRVDNALNQPYRDHLSAIKDFALMPGRNFKLNYKIVF